MPTLLMVGSDDPYCPHMERLAKHMPNARLCALAGVAIFRLSKRRRNSRSGLRRSSMNAALAFFRSKF